MDLIYPNRHEFSSGGLDPLDVGIKLVKSLYGDGRTVFDDEGRMRLDTEELNPKLQKVIKEVWDKAQPGDMQDLITQRGFEIFKVLFHRLYGFDVEGVDYSRPYEFDISMTPEMGVINLLEKNS